jgi:hypothetical protein
MNNVYVRGLLRFWWVVVIGLGVALFGAIVSVEHIRFSAPPKLTSRAHVTYSSSAQLLVDSPTSPFFRTAISKVVGSPRTIAKPATSKGGSPTTVTIPAQVQTQAPDTTVLVNAANLYPLIIESDTIAKLRTKLFGELPGSVSASAALSSATPFGPYRPSPVPVINITAVSTTPRGAERVAQQTVVAFERWLRDNQQSAGVQKGDRIIIRELQSPLSALTIGGTSFTTAAVVFLAVLAAFAGLAIVLARVLPERERADRRTAAPSHSPSEATIT